MGTGICWGKFRRHQEKYLIAAGEFEGIRVFDIEKEACIQTVPGHESRVKALEVVSNPFPDEDSKSLVVVSVSSDGDLRAWCFNKENLEEEANLLARYEMNGRPTCLTVSFKDKSSENRVEAKKKTPLTQGEKEEREEKRRETGDEPTKKKMKKKKKTSKKKKKTECSENEPKPSECEQEDMGQST